MARVLCEFYCTECYGYVYCFLNTALDGNHIVICPACQHKHYRVVRQGVITEDRFDKVLPVAEEIMPVKSAYQKEKRPLGEIALLRQREAIGELT